ncbi:MAG: hypothetical protein H6767_06465 [Candidatus Peribacteria bacterium]|nr:MAG: hypothetical protein H6767_06465 [Candidatus Peribacteria bacterium]
MGNCSGVFSTLATYQKQTSTRMQEQYVQVLPMIEEIYGVYNFLESRYVAFLVEQSDERIRPIEVLSAFDTLKNEFEPILKSNIQCRDFVISEGNVLKAKCEAFTSRLDDRIV